jgi:DNA-binding GntR family transcriptional regulator
MKTQSISDVVFKSIESDILSGVYKSGDVLSENKLAQKFSVSRTPVREAVKRLEQEGLIEYTSTKTIKVLGVTKSDVLDIYRMRLSIEADAVIKASENMSDDDYNSLIKIVDLQEFYALKGDAENMNAEDSHFHVCLYELSKSNIYNTVLTELHKKIRQYRKVSQSKGSRGIQSIEEHRAILSAMRQKDVDLIAKLTNEHIINARNNIISLEDYSNQEKQ